MEEKEEEKIEVGYYADSSTKKVAEINFSQKKYFKSIEEPNFDERLLEEFDESKAEANIKIVGKFVDYYGLAQKYHFSFQARKNQEEIGKQKILCIVEDSKVSEVIDFLKPERQEKNICICGKATKNKEGKIDKIKIDWFNEDENHNPNQVSFL